LKAGAEESDVSLNPVGKADNTPPLAIQYAAFKRLASDPVKK